MIEILPPVLQHYFAAKAAEDIEAMLATFAGGAVVQDEGALHEGHAAICTWMEQTIAKYHDRAEPVTALAEGGRVRVAASISGDFPGSPIMLAFDFTLEAGQISRLAIG